MFAGGTGGRNGIDGPNGLSSQEVRVKFKGIENDRRKPKFPLKYTTKYLKNNKNNVSIYRGEDMWSAHFVLPLAKTVEDFVRLWRFGNEEEGIHPLRLLETAAQRRRIIPNYCNNRWVLSGGKYGLKRFKRIIHIMT